MFPLFLFKFLLKIKERHTACCRTAQNTPETSKRNAEEKDNNVRKHFSIFQDTGFLDLVGFIMKKSSRDQM